MCSSDLNVRCLDLLSIGELRIAAQLDLKGGTIDLGRIAFGERRTRAKVMKVRLEEAFHDVEVAAERERGRGGQRIEVLCGVRSTNDQFATTCGLAATRDPTPLGVSRTASEAKPRERCRPAGKAKDRKTHV